MEGLGPRMSRNALSNIWKKGDLVLVGLNICVPLRKAPSVPRTANDSGSMNLWMRWTTHQRCEMIDR